jgi:hypothetical protein
MLVAGLCAGSTTEQKMCEQKVKLELQLELEKWTPPRLCRFLFLERSNTVP